MKYISDNLSHFVGRSLKSDDERYELLIKIITEERLLANINKPDNPGVSSRNDYSCEKVGEVYERIDCVCFCDIPDEALEIHIKKYGYFGVGFNRSFVSSHGAHPVMYIPQNHNIKEILKTDTIKHPNKYFSEIARVNHNLLAFLMFLNMGIPFSNLLQLLQNNPLIVRNLSLIDEKTLTEISEGRAHQLLFAQLASMNKLLAFVKIFDDSLDECESENYYMEREWRLIGNLNFVTSDIKKVYLPSDEYRKRFVNDVPNFKGDFFIFDNV